MTVIPSARYEQLKERVEWLFAPLALEEFQEDYYEQRACLIKRGQPEYYSKLVSLADLDDVLGNGHLRHPKISMARAAEDVLVADFTYRGRMVDPVSAAHLVDDGATLVFPHLHERIPELKSLTSQLRQFFSSPMQTNVYFTPPNSRGFHPHWDTHDVFILQVFGSKAWKIYDTKIELPLVGQKFKLDNEDHQPGEVSQEFVLEAGDLLYIPRGLMHSADSLDEMSLHVTTGLMAFTWAGLLLELVSRAALEQRDLRENLPLGFARANFSEERLREVFAAKLKTLSEAVDPIEAYGPLFDGLIADHRPAMGDLLRQTLGIDAVGPDSWIEPRLGALYRLERSEGMITVKAFGNDISFPEFTRDAVLAALETLRFRVRDLPDVMDTKGKLVLCKRLIREGLLVHRPDEN